MKQLLWLKFYPKDWNGDYELRSCTLAARGLLAALLEPMHKAEPYGHLLVNGAKPAYAVLAKLASCKEREVKYGIEELVHNGVLSVRADGVLFSRRMVRDAKRQEKRQKDGKSGGNPQLVSEGPIQTGQPLTGSEVNHEDNHVVKPIEARSQRPEARKNVVAPTDPGPVKRFLVWFQSEYRKHRHGATYVVKWEHHGKLVKELLRVHPYERLQKHAFLLLTTDEDWTSGTDRGIGVLSTKINWLEERLSAWEVKHGQRRSEQVSTHG